MRTLCLALVLAGSAPAAPTPAERSEVALPVSSVLVFSDRARVTREGSVAAAKGLATIALPRLPPTIDAGSVRLEATGARVVRVEVRRSTPGALPRSEAETLVKTLERLSDEDRVLAEGIAALEGERLLLANLRPRAGPLDVSHGPALLLEPGGWKDALGFVTQRERAIALALAPLEAQRRAKQQEIREASERAGQLLAGTTSQPGWEVDAILEGAGKPAALALTYVAMQARWYPAYDVRFDPDARQVDVAFSGLVSQETGEDWTDAKLVLSTAVPATTTTVPELSVWKIGDRERFIPTPQARPDPPRPPPPPMPMPRLEGQSDDELRSALQQALGRAQEQEASPAPPPPPPRPQARPPPPGRWAPAPPPASRAPSAPRAMPSAPMPEPAYEMDEASMESAPGVATTVAQSVSGLFRSKDKPSESVSFGAPGGWRPPVYAADLPATLAGGYAFTYPAAGRATVRTGDDRVRVGLHAMKLPAEGLVRIFPALRREAYLVADVKNTSERPLLKGAANLFVGADMVGEAVVPTTAKGQTVTLPLGVDDAIRIERQVNVVGSEKGVFSKKDVTRYEVVIELLNPRAKPVDALVTDQVPLRDGENVEVALLSTEPPLKRRDDAEGLLEWRLDLPPGAKKVLKFTYTLTRPKDSTPWQRTAPKGGR